MRDVEVGKAGKAGMGAACVVCCAVPMVVLTGVVSVAAALSAGLAAGAVVLVLATAFLVSTGRLASLPDPVRWVLAAAGGVSAFVGLWSLDDDTTTRRAVLIGAVGLLATAGLLALTTPRGGRRLRT